MALTAGTVLQTTYEIVRRIGQGAMGEVYEAKHARLPGRFAIKVLHHVVAGNRAAVARFRREAEITSALRHPNIVQVVDFNQLSDGTPYIVMEFLEGMNLEVKLGRGGRLSPRRAAPLVSQIASALAAAHRQGVVHRDLKPQNVFIVRVPGQDIEFAKIVDFGISKVKSAAGNLTSDSVIMGTPQYMAPEQATGRGDDVDPRTDQFALAAITFEMLTGQPAFQGDSLPAILYKVVHQNPPRLGDVVTWIGPDVDAIIRRGLSKRPDQRYPSILEYAHALEEVVGPISGVRRVPEELAAERPPSAAAETDVTVAADGTVGQKAPPEDAGRNVPERQTTFGSTASELTPTRLAREPRRNKLALAGAAGGGLILALIVAATTFSKPGATAAGRPGLQPAGAVGGPAAAPSPAVLANEHATVTVTLNGAPPGLEVTVDGVLKDLPITLPRGSDVHALSFEAPGYQRREMKLEATRDRTIKLAMKRERHAGAPAAASLRSRNALVDPWASPPPPRTAHKR